jgi:hypothetical protein
MSTNILTLPLVTCTLITGNNEDWLDSFQFVNTISTDVSTPVDLAGIEFKMELRSLASDVDVLITASTEDGRLMVGGTEDSFLVIRVPAVLMETLVPADYVADIVAEADGYRRVIVQISPITIFQGVTRRPTPVVETPSS